MNVPGCVRRPSQEWLAGTLQGDAELGGDSLSMEDCCSCAEISASAMRFRSEAAKANAKPSASPLPSPCRHLGSYLRLTWSGVAMAVCTLSMPALSRAVVPDTGSWTVDAAPQ